MGSGPSDSALDSLKPLERLWFTVKQTELNKQSHRNFLKSCPSSLFLLPKTVDSADGTEKDDIKPKKVKNWKKRLTKKESTEEAKEPAKKTKEPAGKSIMIRLYPNKSQTEILNNWFGTARWTSNQVVSSLRASPRDPSKYATVKEL